MKVVVFVPVGPAQPVGTRQPVSQSPLPGLARRPPSLVEELDRRVEIGRVAGPPVPGQSRVTKRPQELRPRRGLVGGEAERGLQQNDGIANVAVLGLDISGERGQFGAEDQGTGQGRLAVRAQGGIGGQRAWQLRKEG